MSTETTLPPGRDLDVAVARAMDLECRGDRSLPQVWVRPTDHWVPFDVSTDDATALRWGVPWLNKNGWWPGFTQVRPEEDEEGTPGDWFVEVTRAEDHDDRRYMAEAKSIAAALAQVIVAVAAKE